MYLEMGPGAHLEVALKSLHPKIKHSPLFRHPPAAIKSQGSFSQGRVSEAMRNEGSRQEYETTNKYFNEKLKEKDSC